MQSATGIGLNSDLGPGSTNVAGRIDNSVKWVSPRVAGFNTELFYSFNENAGAAPHAANQGMLLSYVNGALYLAGSFDQLWSSAVVVAAGQPAQSVRNDLYGVGAVYDTGNLVLSGAFNQYAAKLAGDGIARVYTLGTILPYGRHAWRISTVYRETSGVRDGQGKLAHDAAFGLMLGYDYSLSKRVGLYARAGLIRNYGISTIMLNNNPLPTQPGSATPMTGTTPVTASVGMFYSF